MDDLGQRFKVFDGVRTPDLWLEIVRRAETDSAGAISGAGVRWRQTNPGGRPLMSGIVALGSVATLVAGVLVVGALLSRQGPQQGTSPAPILTPAPSSTPSPAPAMTAGVTEIQCVTPPGFRSTSSLWPVVVIDRSGLVEGCRRIATPVGWWPEAGSPGGAVNLHVRSDGSIEVAWVIVGCDEDATIEVIPELDHLHLNVRQTRTANCAPGTGLRAFLIELPPDASAGATVDLVWVERAP